MWLRRRDPNLSSVQVLSPGKHRRQGCGSNTASHLYWMDLMSFCKQQSASNEWWCIWQQLIVVLFVTWLEELMMVSFHQTDLPWDFPMRIGEPDPTHGQFFNFLFNTSSVSFRHLRNENDSTSTKKHQCTSIHVYLWWNPNVDLRIRMYDLPLTWSESRKFNKIWGRIRI